MKYRGDINFGRGDLPSTANRDVAERLSRRREGIIARAQLSREWPAGSKTLIGVTKCPV